MYFLHRQSWFLCPSLLTKRQRWSDESPFLGWMVGALIVQFLSESCQTPLSVCAPQIVRIGRGKCYLGQLCRCFAIDYHCWNYRKKKKKKNSVEALGSFCSMLFLHPAELGVAPFVWPYCERLVSFRPTSACLCCFFPTISAIQWQYEHFNSCPPR